jgi:hypothetical protein
MKLLPGSARIALGLILAGGALVHGSAGAQISQSSLTLDGRAFAVSPVELARLTDLGQTVHSINRVAQDRALEAARVVANGADARYLLAIYQLEIGRQRQDDALRARALDVLIADRQTLPGKLVSYLGVRGDIAFRAGDFATASSLWTRLMQMQPSDPQTLNNLAQARAALNDAEGAIGLLRGAIAATQAGPAPQIWYRQWLSIANQARLLDQGVAAARALVTAYPTPANWRDALVVYRQLAAPQETAEIDLLQLMRAAGVLARPAEYQRLAQLLLHAGYAGEGKNVLDEGIARGVVNRAEPPTPAIGAEIDRAIARPPLRSGPPPAFLNGPDATARAALFAAAVASYRAGRRPEAEAQFRAVAQHEGGQGAARWYSELAAFWLIWLAQPR